MTLTDSLPTEAFWQEDSFSFIKPDEFQALGIDETDIPPGTFAAHKHPSQLPSRFGGNAYGFGFFEAQDRLKPEETMLLQSIAHETPEYIKNYYKEINRVYKQIGLLIRFSSLGKPYYLIPINLVSTSLSYIKNKANEISKIIHYHRRKYLKENHKIGLVTHADDLVINDLSVRFMEHDFVVLDSLEKLSLITETMDLVILTRDIFEIVLMEKFGPRQSGGLSKGRLETYAIYLLGKVYEILKPDGEIFIIADRLPLKTSRTVKVAFKTDQETKNFILFSHIFKTKKKYVTKDNSLQVNVYDLQKYLSDLYVEQEVLEELLEGNSIKNMNLEKMNRLPHLNFPLENEFDYDQERVWPRLLSNYFNRIFLKPLLPDSIKEDWGERFSFGNYTSDYMIIYLGQKRPPETTLANLRKDVIESRLSGCPLSLLADYRDSFDFVIRTLDVLRRIKGGSFTGLPDIFMERLKEPLQSKRRRYSGLNDVLKLMTKTNKLDRVRISLNPDQIEGPEAGILKHLGTLSLFGFTYGELKEIFLIVVGHTPMGRILSGKMNERALKPVSDMARSLGSQQALNLLRYCRLMSMAETVASRRSELNQAQLAELFSLYESMVRVVTAREMDWDRLLDEKISSMGGIHNKIIRKILKMMNQFQFLDNWSELGKKGKMEKETLADYDAEKLANIENIIKLVKTIEKFERVYFKGDALQLSIFYRKLLNIELHGTGHIFERMDSQFILLLLWITVNVVEGDIINFNPILADVDSSEIDGHVRRVEEEAKAINTKHLDLDTFRQFSQHLYEDQVSFIVGTGFQLKVNRSTKALDLFYIDMDKNIRKLEGLINKFIGCRVSDISIEELEELERLFSNLEGFYQGHLRFIAYEDSEQKLPKRQKNWFEQAGTLREHLRSIFLKELFQPENVYTELYLLYNHARSLLKFILPEIMALQKLKIPGKVYLKTPLIEHILKSAMKIQALIKGDWGSFQDIQLLHKLAQREFGPMVAGIVGLNESQMKELEVIVERLGRCKPLLDALIKSFIFQDMGFIPEFREKYRGQYNPADHAQAGALFLEREKIPLRYNTDKKAYEYLIFLVKYHDMIHHMIRGEISIYAVKEILQAKDKDLFDAFFISSFTMFIAMREDLVLEDLASRFFRVAALCHRILRRETTLEDHLNEVYARRGHLYYGLKAYQLKGLPEDVGAARYLELFKWEESERENYIRAGKMIYALERILKLRGIRYVEFRELANLMVKVPLKFIHKKRNYSGVGYATFEKELFEAHRIYNGLITLPDEIRHFILQHLVADEIRLFGFENVTAYLNYENQIKLLLIALMGAQRFKKGPIPISLNFLDLTEKIEKRYEVVNEQINGLSVDRIWENRKQIGQFFKAKTGLVLKRDESKRVLSIDFIDRINISQKISHMETSTDVDQLKNYFHYSLRSLRKNPFYTEDYELRLERAFDGRLEQITEMILNQAKTQMDLLQDFRDLHNLISDLSGRALDIGFTDEQRHRLNDLYELRKDSLKRMKLEEINQSIERINDTQELIDYWESIKWYLLNNRQFLGKEFESLLAKKFDETMNKLKTTNGVEIL